ncbi:cytochrome oxidase maturation protein, cbb3-type [Leptonema illini DSM 21528]|jgi:cbb3-type cytochrome oxidase maturation protein|uniref:Cytochrome oxidase maturation protein, cbb3-type n=2 Tax=Leptonema illini TaxID=183 RepID=H2CED3_9LEPT|nr:cytochrome oxidase maturation protein, cbb3-type [Leptonema illini DSM 21528]
MPGLLIMLPIAVIIALGFLVFFFWSVKNGDYNDPEMPGHRMVLDEEDDVDTSIKKKSAKKEGRA